MANEPLRGSVIPLIVPALSEVRGVVGWMGLHQIPVTLYSWVWTAADGGNRIGTGVPVPNPPLPIGHVTAIQPSVIQPPHITGNAGDVAIRLDWVSPAFYAADGVSQLGGFTTEQLNPQDAPGLEYLYVVAWKQGDRHYAVGPRGVTFSKSMHYSVQLVAVDRVLPF